MSDFDVAIASSQPTALHSLARAHALTSRTLLSCNVPPSTGRQCEDEYATSRHVNRAGPPAPSSKLARLFERPAKVLDAPGLERFPAGNDLLDGKCSNLLDWSLRDVLAVALGPSVYLWRRSSEGDGEDGAEERGEESLVGTTEELFALDDASANWTTSVGWIHDGTALASSHADGRVQVWDAAARKRLRTLRVASLPSAVVTNVAWARHLLTGATAAGDVCTWDVRVKDALVKTVQRADRSAVCNVKWSPDGRFLATSSVTGGLQVWDDHFQPLFSSPSVLHSSSVLHHSSLLHSSSSLYNSSSSSLPATARADSTGAALAWCPWQPGVLVGGDGVWDVLASRHVSPSTSGLAWALWMRTKRQFLAGHGDGSLTCHDARSLAGPSSSMSQPLSPHALPPVNVGATQAALSADGCWLVTGVPTEECLKFWRVDASTTGVALAPRLLRTRAALSAAALPGHSSNGVAGGMLGEKRMLTRKSPFSRQ